VPDVAAALAKGDLKFTLDGYKLKGSWVLVRTRGYAGNRGDARSWLLIKHRDDWSGEVDITTFAPRSVKSDQDFPEILAEDNPDIWRTNRPVSGGETGAMLRAIIERAAAIKAERRAAREPAATSPAPRTLASAKTTARKAPGTTKTSKKTTPRAARKRAAAKTSTRKQ
jgi:bifunctional non-homologous end joining protein LigD